MSFCFRSLLGLLLLALGLTPPAAAQVGPVPGPDRPLSVPRAGQMDPDVFTENPCADGFFLDYSSSPNECRPLDTEFGFSQADFDAEVPNVEYNLLECTYNALIILLDQVRLAGGGTVTLPACTIEVANRSIFMPDNVALQGAGAGQTIIAAREGFALELIVIRKNKNVIIRDMTLDSDGSSATNVAAVFSDNVLVERTELMRARQNGFHFAYSQRVTARYNASHDHVNNNGISSKDCFPESIRAWKEDESLIITEALCEEHIADIAFARHEDGVVPGTTWTTNYAVYSNRTYDNLNDYGLALHAINGEVAGNLVQRNRRCMKIPDSFNIRLHHNTCEENVYFGIHIYAIIVDRFPNDVVVYNNRIVRNGEFAMRLEGVQDISLIDNHYEENNLCYETCWPDLSQGTSALNIDIKTFGATTIMPQIYACPVGEDIELPTSGSFRPNVLSDVSSCSGCRRIEALSSFAAAPAASLEAQAINVNWSTTCELDVARFELEHRYSDTGLGPWTDWSVLTTVDAAGTSSQPRTYSHRAEGLDFGGHQFRLKHVRADGSSDYTGEVEAQLALPGAFIFSGFAPNPFNEQSTATLIVAREQTLRVEVFDLTGRLVQMVYNGRIPANATTTLTLDGANLWSGAYLVRVMGEEFAESFTLLHTP